MFILIFDQHNSFALDNKGQMHLDSKPTFSFEFDELVFNYPKEAKRVVNGVSSALSSAQCDEVKTFVTETRSIYIADVIAIDSNGWHLGTVKENDPRISEIVPYSPPNGDRYRWVDNEWKLTTFVDKDGRYSLEETEYVVYDNPPKSAFYVWDFAMNKWVDNTPIDALIEDCSFKVLSWAVEESFRSQADLDFKTAISKIIDRICQSSEKAEGIKLVAECAIDDLNTVCKTPADFERIVSHVRNAFV